MDLGIEGRVAVITGGARGIGFAEAEALGAEGAVIAINDIDSVAAMDAAAILRARGIQASAFPADAADEAEVAEAMRKIAEKFGKIAILVNNAGIGVKPDYSAYEMPVEIWDSMQRAHVRSTFLWSRAAIPFMRLGGYGRIVNIASVAGKEGNPNASHYSASKAGLISLTKSLAKELATSGVLVNCVTPAAAKTAIFDQMTQAHLDYMLGKIPMGRFVEVDEIAAMVAWLASQDCSFSTGAVFDITGGRATY